MSITVDEMFEACVKLKAEGHGGLEVLFTEPNEYYSIAGGKSPRLIFDEDGAYCYVEEAKNLKPNAVLF